MKDCNTGIGIGAAQQYAGRTYCYPKLASLPYQQLKPSLVLTAATHRGWPG